MAEVLEKFFDEKLSMMPPEEYEIVKGSKTVVKAATSTSESGEPIAKKSKIIKPRSIAAGNYLFISYLLEIYVSIKVSILFFISQAFVFQ